MILQGNSIRIPLRDESVHAIVTSPPYWNLRDYSTGKWVGGSGECDHKVRPTHNVASSTLGGGKKTTGHWQEGYKDTCLKCGATRIDNQIGLEPTIAAYLAVMVQVFREVWRVLRPDGVCFVNLGDSYSGGKNGRSAADTKAVGNDDRTFRDKPFSVTELPAKNLCMIPARVAIALQEDGWILRSEMGWYKGNPMPSSVQDRPGTAHEHVFMLVKAARYYYDGHAVRKAGKEWTGQAGTFSRANGKSTQLEVPGQAYVSHRERDDRVPSGRALRTSDPFFDSLDAYIAHLQDVRDNGGMLVDSEGLPAALVVNTASYKAAHYATFPRKLISPLIKTTPEKVCPNCGKAWQRLVEKEYLSKAQYTPENEALRFENGRGRNVTRMGDGVNVTTTGWQPTCKCIQKRAPNFGMKGSELLELADEVARELAPIPAIVLDPFCGSGTVGQVARELGRRFIGIDLSAKYLAENALPRSERKMSLKALGQLPMFADVLLDRFIRQDDEAA